MWVVKLGGSLEGAGHLQDWATSLADARVPLVIVPGGGRFADRVRDSQRHWGIDDEAAHRMAILAMEQTAHLLCAMSPRLVPTPRFTQSLSEERRARVWFPARELLWDRAISHSWDITSDSLAAVLAQRIQAKGLVIVKSAPLGGRSAQVGALQEDGILDRAFADHGRECACPVWLLRGTFPDGFHRLVSGQVEGALRVCFEQKT